MRRILITGKNGYIGRAVGSWFQRNPEEYSIGFIDLKNKDWEKEDFSKYDVIFHAAGIAHRHDVTEEEYERINYSLAVSVAKKAAKDNVNQFIFMSSGAVYSQNDRLHKRIYADANSELAPSTAYGKTKLAAEKDIIVISKSAGMKLAILRPPMVYGENAKGNYVALSSFALKVPVFPKVDNCRSMIYIDNLCEFVRMIVDEESEGVFLPQNREYVNTSELIQTIRLVHGKKTVLLPGGNWLISILGNVFDAGNKVFGSFYYAKEVYYSDSYQIVDFIESIKRTEGV